MEEVPQLWSPVCAPSSSCHLVSFTVCRPVWPGASSSKSCVCVGSKLMLDTVTHNSNVSHYVQNIPLIVLNNTDKLAKKFACKNT